MTLSTRFEELVAQIDRLLRSLDSLGSYEDHLDTSTRLLQELLTEVVRTLRSRAVETRDDPYVASLSAADGEVQFLPNAVTLGLVHHALRWVERSGFHAMPPERLPALRSMLRPLAPRARVVFQARRDLTFSTFPLRELFSELFDVSAYDEPLRSRLETPMYVVRVPIVEKDHVLFDPLFGHEFGHITWWERDVANLLKRFLEPDAQLIEDVSDLFSMRPSELRRRARDTGFRWLEELFCDIVGVYLYGYSYACAFTRFMHCGERVDSQHREDQEHPPLRLRLVYVQHALTQYSPTPGASEVETLLANELDAWQQYHSTMRHPGSAFATHDVLVPLLQGRVASVVDEAWRLLTSWGGPRSYAAASVSAGYRLLQRLVPPVALPSTDEWQPAPFDDASVLTAGWAFRLANYPSWQRMGWDANLCAAKLDGLLERAIDSGELLRRRGEQ